MESFKNNNLDLRHVSFKFSSKQGMFNAIRMNHQNKNKMWFEVLKGVKVEDEVKNKGEEGTLKKAMQKIEVILRRTFIGIEIGRGTYKMKFC